MRIVWCYVWLLGMIHVGGRNAVTRHLKRVDVSPIYQPTEQVMSAMRVLQPISTVDKKATIAITVTNQYIYDKSPKLRIHGTGFTANDHDILLDIEPEGQQSLVKGKEFLVTKDVDGDGLILKLLGNRR
jgi:hypothetical protein